MNKVLIVDPDKCTSCRLCELVCSEAHGGAFRPSRSHIRVNIDADKASYFPMVCIQCEETPCIEECPSEALVRDPDTNVVMLIAENCTECGLCEAACPYGAVRFWDGIAQKCDLCGGDPECVRFCAGGALRYESLDAWDKENRRAYVDKLLNLEKEVKA